MTKKIFSLATLILSFCMFGQVGLGTATPDPSSALDLTSTNKGFLPPRVALQSLTDNTTIPNPAKSLIVYNTNSAFSAEGIYINMGTSASPNWKAVQLQTPGNTIIEYTNMSIVQNPVEMKYFGNANNIWYELTDLQQKLKVSLGAEIKTSVTVSLVTKMPSGLSQCDILIKITPGTTPLASQLTNAGPRDSYGLIVNNGSGQSVAINAAKSMTAVNTDYVIQVYFARNNSPNNPGTGDYYQLSPAYINTLATVNN